MNFDRFSKESKNILNSAQEFADTMKTPLSSEHILLGILEVNEEVSNIFAMQGISFDKIHLTISLQKFVNFAEPVLADESKTIIEKAYYLAHKEKTKFVLPKHLTLAILKTKYSKAYKILLENGADIQGIANKLTNPKQSSDESLTQNPLDDIFNFDKIDSILSSTGLMSKPKNKNILTEFATDLIEKAKKGKLDPVIGRKKEIERMIVVLNRKTKNNPVLVGDAGTGKTAIVEGIAQLIAYGKAPTALMNKRIYSLDLASMISGTKYRGEFEERLTKAIKRLKKDKNSILFVDEIHNIMGAGSAEGSMDAANILKPALARGEIRVIGATTFDDYRKHIEKDSALERRMAKIVIHEPSADETLDILKGLKPKYEKHHQISIPNDTLENIIKLSKRYINDRFFPDKAIDILDEAASEKSLKLQESKTDKKSLLNQITILEEKKKEHISNQEFEKAAKIRDKQNALKQNIKNHKNIIRIKSNDLTPEDVARVVSQVTGIPLGEIVYNEAEKLTNIEKILKEYIKGQDEATKEVASTIKRARTGVSNPRKPLGSFIFLGPTGVGKTELAKIVAEKVFQNSEALIKFDMSEFSEKHNVSKLIGAPPGYVGYDDSGKLTEAVRRNPYSVVLFDEIEKAHPDFQNILLQVLEDGYLTDSKGKKVNFKNTIVILTSNIGLKEFRNAAKIGFSKDNVKDILSQYEDYKSKITKELKNHFRPEFLNRVDKIIFFKPLTRKVLQSIIKLQIQDLNDRLKDHDIMVEVNTNVEDKIMKMGYDPENGARPIRRAIQDLIEEPLSDYLIDLGKNFSRNNPRKKTLKLLINYDRKIIIKKK